MRNAWIADDAFIAFRAARNWVEGHGLVSNVGERVQAFTSPLNTLLIAAGWAVLPNAYAVALLLNLIATVATVLLVVRAGRASKASAAPVAGVVLLSASGAFVEFSTSGLENALAHALLALFFVHFLSERRGYLAWLAAGLVTLNRLDHVLLIAPALTWMLWQARGGIPKKAALAVAPMLAWETVSMVYYGFPFPNTAYAKLTTTLPRSALLGQGLSYLVDSLERDPVTLLTIAGVAVAILWVGSGRARLAALGIIAYLIMS